MIPGPIEFEPAVLAALGAPTTGHVSPDFIETFGQALERMRSVFMSSDGQPLIVAGSGTLAMDLAGSNLIEPGDKALVINTGYFSDRFALLLERYGAEVTQVTAGIGARPSSEEVEKLLRQQRFKLMTVTHVDTSTGVLNDVAALASLAHRYETLIVVDGVCSVAAEELRMTEWGVDVVLTASQKAISVPPGLAMLMAGPRAIAAFNARRTPVANFYADWANWLPVMQAYESRKASYFATPAVNSVWALNVSLGQILAEGMEERFRRHCALGTACQRGISALGLSQVPIAPEFSAHAMSAPRYPQGITGSDLLPAIQAAGVTVAGGVHPAIRNEYFRIGHMGPTSVGDLLATLGAVEAGLRQCGYKFEWGESIAAAQAAYRDSVNQELSQTIAG